MKFTAYISIFSLLLSSFSYAGSSARLLKAVLPGPNSAIVTPPASKLPSRFAPEKNYNVKANGVGNQNGSGRDSSTDSENDQNAGGSSNGQNLTGASAGDLSPFPNGKSSISLNSKNNLIGQSNSNSGTGSGSGSSGDGGRTSPPDGGGSGGEPPGEGLQDKPLWIPMCFFFDKTIAEKDARARIKQVVDDWAGCGIAVDVHSATIADGYAQNDPNALNKAAQFHCPWQNISGADVKYGATQSHPNSREASDRMCDKPHEIKEKEETKDWTVTGCATMAKGVSIVDIDGDGFTSSHEHGHATAQNSPLENYGEHGKVKTDAGRGLQLVNSPVDDTKTPTQHDEGSEANEGYTAAGCQALRSGANDNSQRQIKYNPKAFDSYYYVEKNAELMADFKNLEQPKFFTPTKATVNEPPPTNGDVVRGEPRDIRSSDGSIGARSGSADPGHKKGTSTANNSNRQGSGSGGSGPGSSDPSSSSDPTRRGDDSPLSQGSAVGGGTGGPVSESSTIVANDNNKNSEGGNPTLDTKFFESKTGQTNSSGGASVNDSFGGSNIGSERSESTNSFVGNRQNSENGSDNGFFTENNKTKPEQNQVAARKDARKGYDEKAPEVANRAPSSTKTPKQLPNAFINNSVVDGARKPRQGGI